MQNPDQLHGCCATKAVTPTRMFGWINQISPLPKPTRKLHAVVLATLAICQPVNHLISTISSNYTSHQASNYAMYHICLQILVGAPSATALLQYGIPFLPPSKIVRPYIVSTAT